MLKKLALLVLIGVGAMACNVEKKQEPKKAEKIILLIGDGMGLSQVSVAFFNGEDSTNFWRFKEIGLSETSSTSKITDSAAGATAFACGITTYNGAIAVDVDTAKVETIVELLSKKGWKSGVVSTSSIQHATPASFYAHVKQRSMYEEITVDLVNSDIDFFAGGGHLFFTQRKDSINYLDKLSENGFEWDTTAIAENPDPEKKYGFLLGENAMPQMLEGRGDFLSKATKTAISHLGANENPFFLMVEGSQIDWGGHANEADYLQTELLDFDKVVGQVLDYAQKDGNTLVIVTADHETGGYTLSSGENYDEIRPTFSTDGHSATLVPVFAYGPGAENFGGVYKNSSIYHKMLESINIEK